MKIFYCGLCDDHISRSSRAGACVASGVALDDRSPSGRGSRGPTRAGVDVRRVAFQNDHTRIIHLRGSMIPRAATDATGSVSLSGQLYAAGRDGPGAGTAYRPVSYLTAYAVSSPSPRAARCADEHPGDHARLVKSRKCLLKPVVTMRHVRVFS